MKAVEIKKELEKIAEAPERRYGIYKIIHDKVSDGKLAEELYDTGFAGAVGNIRYGEGFFEDEKCWKNAEDGFRKFKELGMHTWIYDEEGYPSGSAGGYLLEEHPEFIAKGLYCYQSWRPIPAVGPYRAGLPDGELWRAVLLSSDGSEIIDITDSKNKNDVLYFDMPPGGWWLIIFMKRRLFDGTHNSESYASPRDYINLTDSAATDKFIEMTHENYKKHLSDEFGKSIIATFTDEPSLVSWYDKNGTHPLLTWQEDFPEKFYARYGYDILEAMVAVLKECKKDCLKMRCDYWDFIADLTADGFFKKIGEWCHENNLKSSGHLLGEEQLSFHVLAYGSFYRSMRYLDWPGIDQLHATPELLIDERNIPFARFVASFADISGENEVFTEFSDHSLRMIKSKAPKEYYYGSVNWHLAMGINNFTSYFSFDGFSDDALRAFNLYTARMNELMHKGTRASDTAVLYPECDMWATMTVKAECVWQAGGEEFHRVHEKFAKVSWELLYRLVDFDYIDSRILREAKIEKGRLCYNGRSYKNIVLPSFCVAEDECAEKIIASAEAGVNVLALSDVCELSRETGKKSPYNETFRRLAAEGKIVTADDPKELSDKLDGGMIKSGKPHKTLMSHTRIWGDAKIVLLANTSEEAIADKITISEPCSKIYRFDAKNAAVEEIEFERNCGGATFELNLAPHEAYIYITEK